MAYLSLYRKYRPDSFDNLIGQDHIVKTLVNQIESNRLGHAYLFTGTRGTGKTSAAKIFSKAVNCEHPVNGSPCGKCASCVALSDPSQIDVIEIDAASNNGVNEIRDLRENVQYPPVSCKYKVYIIDEVHMLSGAAFNALLKTLEEPPKHAIFILATTEVQKLPATILSRCMRFDFRLIPTEQIADLISKIYDEQGKEYEKEAVFAIAAAGEGSVRDALSIADTALSFGTGKLTYKDVTEILGSSDFGSISSFAESMISGETGKMLSVIDELSSLGKSMGVLIKDVTLFIRNLIVCKTCSQAERILLLPKERYNELKRISALCSEQRMVRMLEIFTDTENSLKYTNHPRVVFETAALKAAKPETDYDTGALLARIKVLEDLTKNGVKTPYIAGVDVSESSAHGLTQNFAQGGAKTAVKADKNVSAETAKSAEADKKTMTESVKIAEENGKTVKPENFDEVKPVKELSDCSASEITGKLLYNLRASGNEMLWNVMQTVKISVSGNILTLSTKNEVDSSLIERTENKKAVAEALSEFAPFEIKTVYSGDKTLDKLDVEADRLKKIFGEDIVIVKD